MRIESVLYTSETSRQDYRLPAQSSFIFRMNPSEERAQVDTDYLEDLGVAPGLAFAIQDEGDESFTFQDPISGDSTQVFVDEPDEVVDFLARVPGEIVLDITGLSHRTWAPILKASIDLQRAPTVLYVEPLEYSRSDQPVAGRLFNLSDSVAGISPIPGFARLPTGEDGVAHFVPLLGFEGARFSYVMDRTDVDPYKTYPVIGMPGFRPEYVSYAFKGNKDQLESDYMHSRVLYAKANCPFDVFGVLAEIDHRPEVSRLKVAPIGTKPHGLGAVLFAISRGERVELLYDHPVRSRKRTEGEARMCVYDVPAFVLTDQFLVHDLP